MERERFDVNNIHVQMLMVIKLQQLQRDALPSLSYDNLEDYVGKQLWKTKIPRTLHVAADDILSITASDIVRFLALQAAYHSGNSLEDFSDLIGGK